MEGVEGTANSALGKSYFKKLLQTDFVKLDFKFSAQNMKHIFVPAVFLIVFTLVLIAFNQTEQWCLRSVSMKGPLVQLVLTM